MKNCVRTINLSCSEIRYPAAWAGVSFFCVAVVHVGIEGNFEFLVAVEEGLGDGETCLQCVSGHTEVFEVSEAEFVCRTVNFLCNFRAVSGGAPR